VVQFRVELIRQGNGLWPQLAQFTGDELQMKFLSDFQKNALKY
jgi:hypothetical protein